MVRALFTPFSLPLVLILLGGSIRSRSLPSSTNQHRLPKISSLAPHVGGGYIEPVIGPLATSLTGIKVFMKALLDTKPWIREANLIPLPWRDEQSCVRQGGNQKLRVGVMSNDEVVKPHPPITRALDEVVGKLRHIEGLEIVEWKPYKHDLAWETIVGDWIWLQ